jgi:translation initiation factor 2-alpha kinase 4
MIQTPEDTYVYDRVISTIFNEERLIAKMQCQHESSKKSTDNSELLDSIIEVAKEVFKRHCAKRFQISPLHTLERNFTENRYVIPAPLKCIIFCLGNNWRMLVLIREKLTSDAYFLSKHSGWIWCCCLQFSRGKTVKILTQGGEMLELCYELRTPFVMSIARNEVCDKYLSPCVFTCVNVHASIFKYYSYS